MSRPARADRETSTSCWVRTRRRLPLPPGLRALRCTCILWGLEATLDAALLVVSELVTNAVVNARSQVMLRLRLRPDRLLIEIEDEDSRLPVLQHNDWDALGGRGLMLVDALAARWGSQPCPFGKLVWAELPLVPGPSA